MPPSVSSLYIGNPLTGRPIYALVPEGASQLLQPEGRCNRAPPSRLQKQLQSQAYSKQVTKFRWCGDGKVNHFIRGVEAVPCKVSYQPINPRTCQKLNCQYDDIPAISSTAYRISDYCIRNFLLRPSYKFTFPLIFSSNFYLSKFLKFSKLTSCKK